MRILFFLFVVMPIAEIMLLIEVGDHVGGLNTIALVIVTAIIGAALLRQQGLDTLFKANQKMAQGQMPIKEMLSGIILAVGGALLLTPGFITDAVGFICLLPLTRSWLAARLLRKGVVGSHGFSAFSYSANSQNFQQGQPKSGSPLDGVEREAPNQSSATTIEGECRRED
ncbi:MAG: UPF0716 protein FxsA [Pseudohongiellaceae bacterium]|jgi:UPF0716 protein FxsA